MSENQSLLHRLEELLSQKKSKKFYAEKLGISEFEVNELMKELEIFKGGKIFDDDITMLVLDVL